MYSTISFKLVKALLVCALLVAPYGVMGQKKQDQYQLVVRVVRPEWIHKPVLGKKAPESKIKYWPFITLKDVKSDKEFLSALQSANKDYRIKSLKSRITFALKVGETWKAPKDFCDVPIELTIETSNKTQPDEKAPIRLIYNSKMIRDDIDKYLNTVIPLSAYLIFATNRIEDPQNPRKIHYITKHKPNDTIFVCITQKK